jgi:type I restriction enzyme S subunit
MFGSGEANDNTNPPAFLGDHLSFVTSGGRGWSQFLRPTGSRFIRSFDVQMNAISQDDAVFVDAPMNAEAKRTTICSGDVLLTITGSRIGRVSAVSADLEGAYVSQHVAILRPKPTILPNFLSFYLSLQNGGQRQIAKSQYGQTKPGLNFDQVRRFQIPLPSIDRQSVFAERLAQLQKIRVSSIQSESTIDSLFASLQHRAFRGEL